MTTKYPTRIRNTGRQIAINILDAPLAACAVLLSALPFRALFPAIAKFPIVSCNFAPTSVAFSPTTSVYSVIAKKEKPGFMDLKYE